MAEVREREERRERAKYVWMFGPRREGDEALKLEFPELEKSYRKESGMVFQKRIGSVPLLVLGVSVGIAIGLAIVAWYVWIA